MFPIPNSQRAGTPAPTTTEPESNKAPESTSSPHGQHLKKPHTGATPQSVKNILSSASNCATSVKPIEQHHIHIGIPNGVRQAIVQTLLNSPEKRRPYVSLLVALASAEKQFRDERRGVTNPAKLPVNDIAMLSNFTNLEKITLTPPVDEGSFDRMIDKLVEVGAEKIKTLVLNEVTEHVTDATLAKLGGLQKLTSLNLASRSGLTRDSIEHISNLKNLTSLNLDFCDISNDDLEKLASLDRLTFLSLTASDRITNVGLGHIAKLTKLQQLHLDYCKKISDVGIAELANLTQLNKVSVIGCRRLTIASRAHLPSVSRVSFSVTR